jgi:hypothetical protein
MIDDPDICRAAELMIKRHGEDALWRALRRAVELAADSDDSAAVIWRQVANAIGDLQRGPQEGEAVN